MSGAEQLQALRRRASNVLGCTGEWITPVGKAVFWLQFAFQCEMGRGRRCACFPFLTFTTSETEAGHWPSVVFSLTLRMHSQSWAGWRSKSQLPSLPTRSPQRAYGFRLGGWPGQDTVFPTGP